MLDLTALTTDFQNEFKLCQNCKGVKLTTLTPQLKKLDPHAKIHELPCVSYCGPGRDYPFVILNNKPITGKNEADLIEKIAEVLGNRENLVK